jgi:hypothetical protein
MVMTRMITWFGTCLRPMPLGPLIKSIFSFTGDISDIASR